jgi:formylglycine-generating enzyme
MCALRTLAALAMTALVGVAAAQAKEKEEARSFVPGGKFATVLRSAPDREAVEVAPFTIERVPVTNGRFAAFVREHPEWRRDRIARVFADEGYLAHWDSDAEPGRRIGAQPVTRVSWFAASAYCEASGGRLPTWHEWEFVSAASETVPDARGDERWRQHILDWYARPAADDLPRAGASPPNYYGVRDVHGVVWEWVLDLGGLMPSVDSREQGDPDASRFCGAGATALERKENYATFMRMAMLTSMKAHYTTRTMGFRCAADAPRPK